MYSVELITEPADFLALATTWNEVVERARVPHPFLRHEWLRAWWECFGQTHQLQFPNCAVRGRQIDRVAARCIERSNALGQTQQFVVILRC